MNKYSKSHLKSVGIKNRLLILLFALLCTTAVFAQQKTINGVVTDNFDEPLIGVNVSVKGTTLGSITDVDGQFSISGVTGTDITLVFSYVGYKTAEVNIGSKTVVNQMLHEDTQTIDEVVVVGYGVQKKETVTGSVSMVKGDELLKSPVANLSQAITGRMSGVVTYQRSGEPGYDGATIRIRGVNSFGDTAPLIVIDGVADRAGGLDRLDPNEIESMSVLKDGSAAIYGARAANGVILITTKKGRAGQKPTLSYSFNYGIAQPTMLPKMADAAQYAELRNELLMNDAMVNPNTGQTPPEVTLWKTADEIQKYRDGSDPWRYPNTNWYDETFRSWAPQQIHNATLEGGTEKVQYFATFGYRDQSSSFANGLNDFKQYNLRISLDAQINDYIKASISLLGRQENFKRGNGGSPSDVLWFTSRGRPTDHAYWPNGLPGPAQEYGRNPVIAASGETGYIKENKYFVQTTAKAEITQPWIEGLKLTLNVSYDKQFFQAKEWFQPWYLYSWDGVSLEADGVTPKLDKNLSYPSHEDPDLKQKSYDQTNTTLGALLTYDRTFGDHNISFLAGMEKDTGDKEYFEAYRRYYLTNAIQLLNAGADTEKSNGSGGWNDNWDRRRMNYFGRLAYNYQEKYLAEFLWRYDGSYMFPKNNRYGFFPGVLLGYRISEENFWKENITFMDYFKIRGSWASMGYDKIYYDSQMQEFQYLATYKVAYGYIIDNKDVQGLEISRFPNPDITWERTDNFNIGIEGRTLNNRLNFELDYFFNKRSNILWKRNASIPQSAGLTLPAENIGKVNNQGFDFRLDWNDRIGNDFFYNLTLTGGFSQNKIKFWDEAAGSPEWQRSTGHMTGTDLYYIFDGVFKDWDEINNKDNRPNYDGITTESGLKPGDMKFKDIDGDGRITPNDRKRFNRTDIPKWNIGLNMFFQYKNFDLTLLWQGAFDAWTRVYHDSGNIGNYSKDVYDNHWSIDNPTDKHPRVHARGIYYWDNWDGGAGKNTYWMRRMDYVRLKNLELGYTIPRNIVSKTQFFSYARVYVSGNNLFTFTGLEKDPESTSAAATNYPLNRILNVGVSLTF